MKTTPKVTTPHELTRAELSIMQILWEKKAAFVCDILEQMPEPRPAYNTVSTIVRILEKKHVVGHESVGKSHRYYPLLDRESYTQGVVQNVVHNFFDNSLAQMVSFFARKEQLTASESQQIVQIAQQAIDQNNKKR